jgi:hypothetical protein
MPTFTPLAAAATSHPPSRQRCRARAGAGVAVLVLIGAWAVASAADARAATSAAGAPPHAVVLRPLPVVVLHRPAAGQPARPLLALPVRVAPPPPTAPSSTPPGQVDGIQAPTPGILAPVATLPAPASTSGAQQSLVPLELLAAFILILLVATVLTARRRV